MIPFYLGLFSNGPELMTKMAATPIYGKNSLKSSSQDPEGRWPWELVCSIGNVRLTQVSSNDDPRLTITYLTSRSNLLPKHLNGDDFEK